MTGAWPVADLDSVARLRALSVVLPHVSIAECVIEAPFDEVWGLAGDLEQGIPRIERGISQVRILSREGEHLELVVSGFLGVRMHLQAILRPGWCVMSSALADIGMAAVPEGADATRFAHFEGSPLLGRVGRLWFRRRIAGDLVRIATELGARYRGS